MNKKSFIDNANHCIQKVESSTSKTYENRKIFNVDEDAFLIGSDKIVNIEQADLIKEIILNIDNVFFVYNEIDFFNNFISELKKEEQKKFILIEENNRLKYIKTLDFYFYFYDFRAYEFLYDYNVVVVDIFNKNYNKTKKETLIEFCKNHKDFDDKIFEENSYLKNCVSFYGKILGINDKHIAILYQNMELKGSALVSLIIGFMIEDSQFKEKSIIRNKLNLTNNISKLEKKSLISIL